MVCVDDVVLECVRLCGVGVVWLGGGGGGLGKGMEGVRWGGCGAGVGAEKGRV